MSDTETVVNRLSDSDALSDNEHILVGEKAPLESGFPKIDNLIKDILETNSFCSEL